jgi:hypothetical protein
MKIIPTGITFRPNAGRVLNRAFVPKKESQIISIINRVLSIGEAEVEAHLGLLVLPQLRRPRYMMSTCKRP